MVQQGVHQRAAGISRASMNGHTRGLVDHNDVVIFVKHIEWNIFRLRGHGQARLLFHADALAVAHT